MKPATLQDLVRRLAPVLREQGVRDHYLALAFHDDPIFDRIPPDAASDPRIYVSQLLGKLDRDPCRRTADGRLSLVVYLMVIADENGGELADALAPIIAQLSGADGPSVANAPGPLSATTSGVSPSHVDAAPAATEPPPSHGAAPPPTAPPQPRPAAKSRHSLGENGSWIECDLRARAPNLILFVHGYTGSTDATWQSFPHLLLRYDEGFHAGYDVGSFGYDTNLVANRETLAKLSAQLSSFLEAHAAGVANVYLVTHSLGGIVARAYMVDVCADARRAAQYAQLAQVHFVASPQEGAPLPGGIARWLRYFNPLAWELRRDSPVLADLLDTWLAHAERARAAGAHVPALYHYLGSKDWVASYARFAAGRLAAAETFNVVDSDHTTLVKPVTTGSTVYTLVTRRIRAAGDAASPDRMGAAAPATGGVAAPPTSGSSKPPPTVAADPPVAGPSIDPTLVAEIVRLVADHSPEPGARRALLLDAFFGSPLIDDIVTTGTAREFGLHVIDRTLAHGDIAPGEPALRRLLTVLRGRYGVDKQARIDGIVGRMWP